jgi:hypothetical protein
VVEEIYVVSELAKALNAGDVDLAVSEKSGGAMRLYCGKLTRTWVLDVFRPRLDTDELHG